MKKSNENTNFITIILLMSSIVLLVLSIFLKHVVLNKNTYLELLDKSNTYLKIEDTLYKKMDSLLGSDASEEIKKSIITDEDVRREADNVITCIIDDLKTGQINPIVINTDAYKQRVSNMLESFTGYKTSSDKGILSKSKIERIISSIISDKRRKLEEKLNDISNKLSQKAGIGIDNEIEKLNLDKLINSNKFKMLAKVTAFFNRMNVVFMIFPIIFMAILIEINGKKFKVTLKSIGSAFVATGVILLLFLFGAYMSKFYNRINIAPVYINDMLLLTVKHFFKVLLISEIVLVVIGVVLFVPVIKGSIGKNVRSRNFNV